MSYENHYCGSDICLHGMSTRYKVIKLALLSGWNLAPSVLEPRDDEVRFGKGAWLGSKLPEPLFGAVQSLSVYFDARGAIKAAYFSQFGDTLGGFCPIAQHGDPNKFQRVSDVLTSPDPYTAAQMLRGYWSLGYPRKEVS